MATPAQNNVCGDAEYAQNGANMLAPDDPTDRQVAERLRQAVRAAGGNRAVAERSGVALATVNNYVRPRGGLKMRPLAALAKACGVSLEWLVTGEQSPPGLALTAAASQPGLSEPQADLSPVGTVGNIDVPTLAKAIEIIAAIGETNWGEDPKTMARRIATAYAVLRKPPASADC